MKTQTRPEYNMDPFQGHPGWGKFIITDNSASNLLTDK